MGSGTILTNKEIKDIMTVSSQFLNFLRQLMTDGLPLMKSVVTSLAKKVLVPLELVPLELQRH